METLKTNTGEVVSAFDLSQDKGLKRGELLMIVGPSPNWVERALATEKRLENLDLVLICAQDLVKMWPTVTIRTLGTVTKAIDTLRQALEASK